MGANKATTTADPLGPDSLTWKYFGDLRTGMLGVSIGAIYVLTLACGWYPSRLATKIEPAQALHYE